LSREWEDIDRCRIACDADFFLRIGFLSMKEEEVDRRLGGGESAEFREFLEADCNGP
jgi:hypothetical protein